MTFKLGVMPHRPHFHDSIIRIPLDRAIIYLLWTVDKSRVSKLELHRQCNLWLCCHYYMPNYPLNPYYSMHAPRIRHMRGHQTTGKYWDHALSIWAHCTQQLADLLVNINKWSLYHFTCKIGSGPTSYHAYYILHMCARQTLYTYIFLVLRYTCMQN